MGVLSSSVSLTRYKVEGEIQKPIIENIYKCFKKNYVKNIDSKSLDRSVGWSCFNNPFKKKFNKDAFLIGSSIVFSMRIDKKNIPPKVINKEFALMRDIKLEATGREFLSKAEKKDIKDIIIHNLTVKIPAVPNVYDVIWKYEEKKLLFFSNLKTSNNELESLFYSSFGIRLIKLFPFTIADLILNLSGTEKDILMNLSPTRFAE